jgi:hypothetical protein
MVDIEEKKKQARKLLYEIFDNSETPHEDLWDVFYQVNEVIKISNMMNHLGKNAGMYYTQKKKEEGGDNE